MAQELFRTLHRKNNILLEPYLVYCHIVPDTLQLLLYRDLLILVIKAVVHKIPKGVDCLDDICILAVHSHKLKRIQCVQKEMRIDLVLECLYIRLCGKYLLLIDFLGEIGNLLYHAALSGEAPIGLDIKVLVSIKNSTTVEQVVVAAPMLMDNETQCVEFIKQRVRDILTIHGVTCEEIIVNGTGSYVIHSTVGDAGVVGRKLAVDFYGLNCPIGGGTTWGKDGTKADVTLNLYARYRSLKTMLGNKGVFQKVFTKIGCCIGQSKCLVAQFDQDGKQLNEETINILPSETTKMFGLDGSWPDMYWHMCENGLFTFVDSVAMGQCV